MFFIFQNMQLYDGAKITKEETDILLLSFAMRHSLPDVALSNQLSLLNVLLPQSNLQSKYKFLQSFDFPNAVEYFYCDKCMCTLNFEENETSCPKCSTKYFKLKLKKKNQYFIYIPLKEQIEKLVKSHVYCEINQIDTDCNDITNSSVYKELRAKNVIGINDLTLTWNTDGVNLCKTSKLSMWPIQVIINELPYKTRKNNVLLCGLHYGHKKPDMNMFLEPFATELFDLSINGFNTTTYRHSDAIKIKVHAIVSSVDSVARPSIQNMTQFNGLYGCSYCFQKGERVVVGRGYARVYPFKTNIRPRSIEEHDILVKEAVDSKKIIKGVKGPTIMSIVPHQDIISSYPPEYLHSCLLGVGKLFTTEWFDSKNSEKDWYLGSQVKVFHERLLNMKPPCEVSRTPRSITENTLTASEWKFFILYYSLICLKGLLKTKYYKHWFLFVYSLNIFLRENASDQELTKAEAAIVTFVKGVESLYGKKYMKYNVHLLLHIPMFIRKFGALWAWSAFPFEHYNGVIKSLFHGSQYIPHQICKMYFRLQYIKMNSHIFYNEKCNDNVRKLFVTIMNQCKIKNCIEYDNVLRCFGKPIVRELTLVEKTVVESFLQKNITSPAKFFNRFINNQTLYHSVENKKVIKRNNSCILTNDNKIVMIKALVKTKLSHTDEWEFIILGYEMIRQGSTLCKFSNLSSNSFCQSVVKTENIICTNASRILSKCVILDFENIYYVFPLVNSVERD